MQVLCLSWRVSQHQSIAARLVVWWSVVMAAAASVSVESLRKVREQTNALKDQYFPGFNKKIAGLPVVGAYIDTLGRRTHISNVVLVIYAVIAAAVLATWTLGTETLCTIGGFIYPAIQTFRARDVDDYEQWISYWMIFVTLGVIQSNTYATISIVVDNDDNGDCFRCPAVLRGCSRKDKSHLRGSLLKPHRPVRLRAHVRALCVTTTGMHSRGYRCLTDSSWVSCCSVHSRTRVGPSSFSARL